MTPERAAKPRWGGAGCRAYAWSAVVILSACGETAPAPSLPPLTPLYGDSVTAEQRAFSERIWPKVFEACPGLRRYREDLSSAQGADSGRFVAKYFDGQTSALIAALVVAKQPLHNRVKELYAQGQRCEFAMEYPAGNAVQIAKRSCQQLCIDRPVDSDGGELRLGLK